MPYALNPFDPGFAEEDVERLSEESLALQMPEDYEITDREIKRLAKLAEDNNFEGEVDDEESAAVALDWMLEQGVPVFAPGLEPNEWIQLFDDYEDGDLVRWGDLGQGRQLYRGIPIYKIEDTVSSDYHGGTSHLSNYQVIYEMAYGDEDVDEWDDDQRLLQQYLIFLTGDHGTRGVAIRLDRGPVPAELLEVVDMLGPIGSGLLDDDHHNNLEMELEADQWPNWGRDEWRDQLAQRFPEHSDDIYDLGPDVIDDLWNDAAQNIGWNVRFETGANAVWNFRDGLEEVAEEDIIEAIEGLDHNR